MVQVSGTSIPQAISSSLETQVLYDRSANTLTVFVNGEKQLEFDEVDPALRSGDSIALRSLGATVEFTELSVKTK